MNDTHICSNSKQQPPERLPHHRGLVDSILKLSEALFVIDTALLSRQASSKYRPIMGNIHLAGRSQVRQMTSHCNINRDAVRTGNPWSKVCSFSIALERRVEVS